MNFRPQELTNLLHTRGVMVGVWIASVASSAVALGLGAVVPFEGDGALALTSANNWLQNPALDWAIAMLAYALVIVLALVVNRTFNVLRSMTSLHGTFFAVMMAASPSVFGQLYGGTLLVLAFLLCQLMLYSEYCAPDFTRRTFLIFFVMALTAMACRAAIWMLPLLLVGCLQMRVLTLRTVLAALIGVVTPAWIMIGLGWIDPTTLRWPSMGSTLPALNDSRAWPLITTFGATAILALLATLANLLKSLSYNGRTRAFNGFIAISTLAVLALTLVDYTDLLIYLPLLNLLTAVQLAHFFSWQQRRHSYLPVLGIILLYISLYCWNIWAKI